MTSSGGGRYHEATMTHVDMTSEKASRRGWFLLSVGAASAALLLAGGFLLARDDASPAVRQARARRPPVDGPRAGEGAPGVLQRPADPATRDDVLAPGFEPSSSYRQIAEDAKDLQERLAEGDSRWEPLLIELSATDEAFDAYATCSQRHLSTSCEFSMGLTIVPQEPGHGAVAYVRLQGASECPDYARCMADAYAGRKVPLPPTIETPIGHSITRTDNELRTLTEKPDLLARTIAMLESEVANMQEDQGFGRGDWNLLVAQQRARLRFLKRLLATLDD